MVIISESILKIKAASITTLEKPLSKLSNFTILILRYFKYLKLYVPCPLYLFDMKFNQTKFSANRLNNKHTSWRRVGCGVYLEVIRWYKFRIRIWERGFGKHSYFPNYVQAFIYRKIQKKIYKWIMRILYYYSVCGLIEHNVFSNSKWKNRGIQAYCHEKTACNKNQSAIFAFQIFQEKIPQFSCSLSTLNLIFDPQIIFKLSFRLNDRSFISLQGPSQVLK